MIAWNKIMVKGRSKMHSKIEVEENTFATLNLVHPVQSWTANAAEKQASPSALTSTQRLPFAGVPQGLLRLTL